jgi:twitching motility protein PilI
MNKDRLALTTLQTEKPVGDSYLKFQVNPHTSAVISMKYTQEAVVLPLHAVTAMPNMPSCVLGLMNWRSRIFWAVDLPGMLNLQPTGSGVRDYNVIVIRVESILLGLVVQSIKGVTRLTLESIKSPMGQVASGLVPYLRGCVLQDNEILLVLDAQAIAHSSALRSH